MEIFLRTCEGCARVCEVDGVECEMMHYRGKRELGFAVKGVFGHSQSPWPHRETERQRAGNNTCVPMMFPLRSQWREAILCTLGIWANQPIHSFLVGCLNPCLEGIIVLRGGFRYEFDGFKKLGVQLSDSRLDLSINSAISTFLMSLLLLCLKP